MSANIKYETKVFKYSEIKNQLKKPKFQRHFIWAKAKKESLVDTIKRGLPIGSILLQEEKDDSGQKRYIIIDGLQRISTLNEILNKPFNYIDENEISHEKLRSILKSCSGKDYEGTFLKLPIDSQTDMLNTLSNEITGKLKFDKEDIQRVQEIRRVFISNISFLREDQRDQLDIEISRLISDIKNILNVDDVMIPAIIFNGSDTELATVFEKVNQGGVKLTKYDTFASKWLEILINVKSDAQIMDAVIEKYQYAQDNESLEVDDFDPDEMRDNGEINIFEYAYALGKVLGKESDFLFKENSPEKVDSFGFNLLNALFGQKNNQISGLGNIVKKYKDIIDFSDLKNKILLVVRDLEAKLTLHIENVGTVGLDTSKKKYFFDYKEFQVISFIVTGFRLTYIIDENGINNHPQGSLNNHKKMFNQFLPIHYLYDNFRNKWGNAGDTELDSFVTSDIKSIRYLSKPSESDFENVLSAWLEDHNSKQRKSVDTLTKIALNYLARHNFYNTASDKINFDHIVPQDRLKELKKSNSNYPLSTPCNLVIIPEYGNKQKRELTYYQFADKGNQIIAINEDLLTNNYLYPTRDELHFVTNSEHFTYVNYQNFLNERKKFLVNKFRDWLKSI